MIDMGGIILTNQHVHMQKQERSEALIGRWHRDDARAPPLSGSWLSCDLFVGDPLYRTASFHYGNKQALVPRNSPFPPALPSPPWTRQARWSLRFAIPTISATVPSSRPVPGADLEARRAPWCVCRPGVPDAAASGSRSWTETEACRPATRTGTSSRRIRSSGRSSGRRSGPSMRASTPSASTRAPAAATSSKTQQGWGVIMSWCVTRYISSSNQLCVHSQLHTELSMLCVEESE